MDFQTLYTRLSPALKKIAKGFNGRNLFIDADDLCQEMSIYLWNNYKDGVPAQINDAYIVNGCKLHICNYLRKNRPKATVLSLENPLDENGKTIKDNLCSQAESLHRCLDRKMTFAQILNNGFSRREKEVVLYLTKGFTLREIGIKLGISHVMVLKYKKRVIKKWQRKVTKKQRYLLKRVES